MQWIASKGNNVNTIKKRNVNSWINKGRGERGRNGRGRGRRGSWIVK